MHKMKKTRKTTQKGDEKTGKDAEEKKITPRKFLGIWFSCCSTYGRIYKNKEGTAYTGCCPKCGAKVSVRIGKEGTGRRFFRAE